MTFIIIQQSFQEVKKSTVKLGIHECDQNSAYNASHKNSFQL